MAIASGFIEVDASEMMETVVRELTAVNIEVTGGNNEKIVFLAERETIAEVKAAVDGLRDIPGVRNVSLAYFTLDDEVVPEPRP